MINSQTKFSPEVRERAVHLLQEPRDEYESQWAAVTSIAPKIGCSPHSLLKWVRSHEVDSGTRPGVSTEERGELKELRRANEILRTASAFFAKRNSNTF